MEEKLPFKESHVWTLSDFIERRKDWDQRDEVHLGEYLQHLSNKITQGAKNTLNELNDLVASVDDTVVQIANINNEFQLLADKQFIENKVQEEDETVQKEVEKSVAHKINDANTLVNNVKEALNNSFKAIDTHFEKITVVISDSDDDDDELKHEETVLRPRLFYKKLNLPSFNGNSQSEITANIVMSLDSDSDIEEPIHTFKDEKLLFSNDAPEEDIYSITESKNIHESDPQLVNTYSNNFEPEKLKPKNIPTYTDSTEDDLFSPPPLLNDNDEDDLNNDYNIFGHSSNNIYGERNLWDDNDDDDNNFSNDPPLPIYSEEPPQQVIKSHIQENVEASSIQQSLNDELHKRFQKDNISSSSNNVNVESLKVKLPKGTVNILGGSDIKPYITSSTQYTKQATISQISKSMNKKTQDDNVGVNKDFNVSNNLFNRDYQNPDIFTSKDFKKETKPIKKRSLFEQNSDEEDLFVDKIPKVIPILKPEITKEKENLIKNIKLSRSIFSESDSDEDIMNSKSTTIKESVSHSSIDETKLLDSSSDDDLFNIKSTNNKSIPKLKSTLFSSEVHDEVVNESNKIQNEIKQKLITPIEEDSIKDILNKNIVNESKMDLEESSINANDKDIGNEISNNCTSHSNIIDTVIMDNPTVLSNQTFSNSQYTKKYNNLFSSDEEEFDDSTLFNVNESNKNSTKVDQTITNPTKLVRSINHDNIYASKVKMFDSSCSSSSDDYFFNTNKSNNNFASIKNKQSEEIISIEPQPNDNHALINQVQETEHIDKINATGKFTINKNNSNIFSLLSDEDEDDNYLPFKNDISDRSINLFNSQNINKTVKTMSLSSEEFLSPQMDLKNNDIFHNSSHGSLFDIKDQESFKEKKLIDISKNETFSISTKTTIENIESSIFSNSDDEHLSFNSNILNESHENKISQASYSNASKESLKDSFDGSSFSLSNTRNEKSKKLPGKLNKNAGAFINVTSLFPNSKSPLTKSDIARLAFIDENNDESLPTSGIKLFSAEKDRAKIQVKRRPQSRKARHAAARISCIDIGHESNFNESSRLFGSSSDLVDYQSSPILNDDFINSSNEVQNKNQELLNNKLPSSNNDKTEKNNDVKKIILNLFDDDLDPFKFTQKEINKSNNKEKKLDEKQVCKLVSDNKQLLKIEAVQESLLEIEPTNEKNLGIESVSEKLTEIKPISNEKVKGINMIKVEENKLKSITQNPTLPKKSKSLFDDDDDDDLFSPKREKVKKSSFNDIFDSDDELDFNQKFTKKNSVKTDSIFGDDSDDDLFSTSSKSSASNLPSQKPNDKMSLQQNRPCADGYIKLAAESVAINPLGSKKN